MSAKGTTGRIDYIALPTKWQRHVVRQVDPHPFEVSRTRDDHTPVVVDVMFSGPQEGAPRTPQGK
eukprot:425298-Alexandrium_andersonii.AAC.1